MDGTGQEDRDALSDAIQRADLAGNGFIDVVELSRGLESLGHAVTVEMLQGAIVRLAEATNGAISRESFEQAVVALVEEVGTGLLTNTSKDLDPAQLLFEQLDTKGSGTINADEMRVGLSQLVEDMGGQQMSELLASVDTTDAITLDEFRRIGDLLLTEQRPTVTTVGDSPYDNVSGSSTASGSVHPARACFNAIDVDGSGQLSMDELADALKRMGRDVSDDQLLEIMESNDTDGSGSLNFEEFKNVAAAFLPRLVYRCVVPKAIVREGSVRRCRDIALCITYLLLCCVVLTVQL